MRYASTLSRIEGHNSKIDGELSTGVEDVIHEEYQRIFCDKSLPVVAAHLCDMKHSLRKFSAELLCSILPYTSYPIDESEYLGTYDGSLDECRSWLRDNGYHYQLLAAVKDVDGVVDDGSYARIPNEHPRDVAGTKLAKLDSRECQYHVHPFDKGDHVELYGHYEIHPYPHIPDFDLSRPYPRHYHPTWDRDDNPREEWTYLRGTVDERLEDILE